MVIMKEVKSMGIKHKEQKEVLEWKYSLLLMPGSRKK